MLNINEEDLKAAIVERAADELLHQDADLHQLVGKLVTARIDAIFSKRVNAQIEEIVNETITEGFEREYRAVDSFGTPRGEATSIRAELEKIVGGYWNTMVNPRSGQPDSGYGDKVTRAQYLMTQICAKDFSETMLQSAASITGALKDGLRKQIAEHMDKMLNDLFHVKSLQDQGKVEKPW